jgi:hypothetical protein
MIYVLAFCFNPMRAAPVSTNESGFKLTVELRDGSRVVGKSLDDKFKFHSSLLGDLKLNVNDIRSIDCATINAAKLTTANGDMLAGWLGASALRVETGFGRTELPVF